MIVQMRSTKPYKLGRHLELKKAGYNNALVR
jgi:hypothetical protein